MAEKQWGKAIAFAGVVVVTGITYYFAQRAVDAHRAGLPVQQYLECIQRVSTFNWDQFPGEKPSSSEVCKDLAERE